MKEIDIHYKLFKFLPWHKSFKVSIPTQLSELTEKQFIASLAFRKGNLPTPEVLQIYLGIKLNIIKKINSESALIIIKQLRWIKSSCQYESFIIKKIHTFEAPEEGLSNVTFRAFALADNYFQSYLKGNISDLYKFIACFYCGKIGFNEAMLDLIAIEIEDTVEKKVCEAIIFNYKLIQRWLELCYPVAFKQMRALQKIDNSENWLTSFSLIEDEDPNKELLLKSLLHRELAFINILLNHAMKNGNVIDPCFVKNLETGKINHTSFRQYN